MQYCVQKERSQKGLENPNNYAIYQAEILEAGEDLLEEATYPLQDTPLNLPHLLLSFDLCHAGHSLQPLGQPAPGLRVPSHQVPNAQGGGLAFLVTAAEPHLILLLRGLEAAGYQRLHQGGGVLVLHSRSLDAGRVALPTRDPFPDGSLQCSPLKILAGSLVRQDTCAESGYQDLRWWCTGGFSGCSSPILQDGGAERREKNRRQTVVIAVHRCW